MMQAEARSLRSLQEDSFATGERALEKRLALTNIRLEFIHLPGEAYTRLEFSTSPHELASAGRPHALRRGADRLQQRLFLRNIGIFDDHRLRIDAQPLRFDMMGGDLLQQLGRIDDGARA